MILQYMGSKSKIAKKLIPYILEHYERGMNYVEPFCGGCNMIDKIDIPNRVAADSNYYLIEMWKAFQRGWNPPNYISEEEYKNVRKNKEQYDPAWVGLVGFGSSFGGGWFKGYAKNSTKTNYLNQTLNVIQKQIKKLRGVKFIHSSYKDLDILPGSIVYCDPPYQNTSKYKEDVDHEEFWQWVRKMSKGNHVYVSE